MAPVERTDEKLREQIGRHVVRYLSVPATAVAAEEEIVEPVGMTLSEEGELEALLILADANRDGDEQAAIERLVTMLDSAAPDGNDVAGMSSSIPMAITHPTNHHLCL